MNLNKLNKNIHNNILSKDYYLLSPPFKNFLKKIFPFSRSIKNSTIPFNFIKIYLNQEQLVDYIALTNILISNKIKPNTDYFVLIKVRCNFNLYAMAGNQFAFIFSSLNDFNSIIDLQDSIANRLDLLLNSYNLESYDYICLYFKELIFDKNIKNKSRHMRLDLHKYDLIFGSSYDFDKGIKLDTIIIDGKITEVIVNMENDSFNFLDRINKFSNNKPIVFKTNSSFYLYFAGEKYYIINICKENTYTYTKIAYNLKGLYMGTVVDTLMPNNVLKRSFGANSFFIYNNTVCYREKLYNFNSIKPGYKDKMEDHLKPNPNIGVFDLETYINKSGDCCVYACGYYMNLDEKSTLFYIGLDRNGDSIVLDCLNSMLSPKYSNTHFYCHNFGRYDVVYLLKIVLAYNESAEGISSPFIINCFYRNSVVIKLNLKKKSQKEKVKSLYSITFIDSYSILNQSLKSLSLKFNVGTQKGCFPHTFVSEKTLFYVGKTPDISYYTDLLNVEDDLNDKDFINEIDIKMVKDKAEKIIQARYKELYKDNWYLQEECLIYLIKDLLSLYEVIKSFNKSVFTNFGLQMTKSMTISRLALNLFMTNYYVKEPQVIPLINLLYSKIYIMLIMVE